MKNQHKLIDDYVRDLISEREKAAFEMEITKDKVLQQEVAFRKSIVNHYKFEQVKQTIEQARLENEQEAEKETKLKAVTATIEQAKTENIKSKQRTIVLIRRLSIAAVFFLMIGGGWFGNDFFKDQSSLIKIVTKEADLQNVRTLQKERIISLVHKANQALNKEDFETVLKTTGQLRKAEGFETDEILQNECFIYFKQKNYTKAARQVEGIQNLELQNEVRWKLSKLYLKVGEKDLAKKQLVKIQAGAYKNKAAKKLEKLN